jgi:hypothetical protein
MIENFDKCYEKQKRFWECFSADLIEPGISAE